MAVVGNGPGFKSIAGLVNDMKIKKEKIKDEALVWPTWPFGRKNPELLERIHRKNKREDPQHYHKDNTDNDVMDAEVAPF